MQRRALWFFQRTGPGQIRRISNPSMQRFLVGERALPHDGDGFVRCIGMSLEVQDRKPAQVARVWFSKIRVKDDGKVDPHHHHETAKQAHSEARQITPAGSSVVVAGAPPSLPRGPPPRPKRAPGGPPPPPPPLGGTKTH